MAPRMSLTVLDSGSVLKGTAYLINACGYTKSRRRAFDGCVYAGTLQCHRESGSLVNDIVFPLTERGMGHRHFVVKYVTESKSYFLRDMGEGTGTFIKIDRSLVLHQGYIISYGDVHMAISILSNSNLQLKFLGGPKIDQILYCPK